MPVQRFRHPDEARRALWTAPGDPRLPARIRWLWRLSAHLAPLDIPRGVRKFRRIEDANCEREAWVARRVRALRSERTTRGGTWPPPRT